MLLQQQQQQQGPMVSMPMNSTQLAGNNQASAVSAPGQPIAPGAMNRGPGPTLNAAIQPQQQQQAPGSTATGIRARVPSVDAASNIEQIVSSFLNIQRAF